MKKTGFLFMVATLLFGGATALTAQAQTISVDRTKYPDYSEVVNPDWSLMTPQRKEGKATRTVAQRPDHVNNAATKFFPPVFNQDGGSCGSASRICYMFSYELAAYRNLDGSKAENYYPSHFVWLHTNSPSGITDQGKDAFVTNVGVPSAATYGGQTYSSLFGYQEASNNDFGWMQGYDKWFEAMHNRMLKPSNFPVNVGTEEGREAVKNWLWNHNGDDSFQAGGICGIGVASGGQWHKIPSTDANNAAGVTDMYYVHEWGTQVDHALTIVGYDDRIEFDLDNDDIPGEADADELGAWIIVNSWGDWCNGGFIYCPYKFGVPAFNNDAEAGSRTPGTGYWEPEVYRVRKDYRPLRTIKLEMDYSRRSEIALSAGISADLNATEPEVTVPFVHFTYAGDGNYGNSNPAPEVPMLGRWADGKLHTEPMEFGYDLTDLTAGYDMNQPLKYFFIINTKDWAAGEGTIYNASIMDYQYDLKGIETSFGVGEGVEIKNAGKQTILTVIVQGNGCNAPQNVACANNAITWQAPVRSGFTLAGYRVYADGVMQAKLAPTVTSFAFEASAVTYGVSAVYADGKESKPTTVKAPIQLSNPNKGVQFEASGFTIPNVFATKYQQATIEYWIKPTSVRNYNQMGGPGWGTFHFHANADGHFTAGWNYLDTERVNTSQNLRVGEWTHVAMVVDGNNMTVYFDGVACGSVTSSNFSGIGGFGDLVFKASGNDAQDAVYDEIRIWNTARTEQQIAAYKDAEFTGNIMPEGLVAYLKGDLFTDAEGNVRICDYVGEHHATLQGIYTPVSSGLPTLGTSTEAIAISINGPAGDVFAGIPVTLTATHNDVVTALAWTAKAAGIENLAVKSPTLTFTEAGTHTVSVTATDGSGRQASATCNITVLPTPAPDASFTMTTAQVPAGERVTLHASDVRAGYLYEWSMLEAEITTATSSSVATSWQKKGTYDVTLTVTAPNGTSVSHTAQVKVTEVIPSAAFSVSPAVVVKGAEVSFTDQSLYTPAKWEWVISNGKNVEVAFEQHPTLVMNTPGVYDVTLSAINNAGTDALTRQRALIVTNADSHNGLNFSTDEATVTAPALNLASAFTIEWWMNSEWPADNINAIGDAESTLMLKTMADGRMILYLDGQTYASPGEYVVANEWHHYGVAFSGTAVKFYRDGVLMNSHEVSASVGELSKFRLGGADAPFGGSIDEFRVWGSELTVEQLQQYANAPISDVPAAQSAHGLMLYYDFNQSSGDVQDRTSNANHGVRTGFGPEGDAWGLSKGVFCLNFEEGGSDVTATYLTNYEARFSKTGNTVNTNNETRFYEIADWTLGNVVTDNGITTGAHVDAQKDDNFTVTTGWDNFASTLKDHTAYQTITLPAGFYTFAVQYDDYYEGQCGASYVVAAKGNALPTTEELSQALAYTAMKGKAQTATNSVSFLLTKETMVSVGLLINMSGQQCMTLQRFSLSKKEITIHEYEEQPLTSVDQLLNSKLYYVSQPNHSQGTTSWAVQTGGTALKSNHDLGISPDKDDVRQQFAFITIDGGDNYYLYHPAEAKFVNKDGSLSPAPVDPVYFKDGAYEHTFFAYFDAAHQVNVGGSSQMVINDWSTPDGGNSCSILPVGEFDTTDALEAFVGGLFDLAELHAANVGINVGNYTEESVAALRAAIEAGRAAMEAGNFNRDDLQAAIDALEIVMPTADKLYTITSNAADNRGGKSIYVNDEGGMNYDAAEGAHKLFRFVPADAENTYYMYNVERGLYLSTAVPNGSREFAHATTTDGAVRVSFGNLSANGVVSITPQGGSMIHAQGTGAVIVGWNESSPTDGSAWCVAPAEVSLTEALSHTLTIGNAGWSSLVLGYDAVIPDGITAYVATEVKDGYVLIAEQADILPAHTPVLIEGAKGQYVFTYTDAATSPVADNLLAGTTYTTYWTPVEGIVNYVLSYQAVEEGGEMVVGLFKKTLCDADRSDADDVRDAEGNITEAKADAITFGARKAYLPISVGEQTSVMALRLKLSDATGIEGVAAGAQGSDGIYDIQGRRVFNPTKGLYIVNGKKVMIGK
ncbi:MAG: DUF5013 domain-containing protein [Bacteroidaceae bacterium]|nr:DUF5013 domain-containing protein [Bacteroidaceae bacterium]